MTHGAVGKGASVLYMPAISSRSSWIPPVPLGVCGVLPAAVVAAAAVGAADVAGG
jgi:hypothetical protein